jgi:hypothetical protein
MRKWLGRLRNAIRPGRLDRDLDRELRLHVTERMEELQEAGMSADAAARLARQQFGNYAAQVERTVAARAGEVAGFFDHRCADAGAGHRRQQRGLLGDQCGAVASAAVSQQ